MKKNVSPANGFFKRCTALMIDISLKTKLGIVLAASLILIYPLTYSESAALGAEKARSWPVKDFLPPIATINPKLDEGSRQQADHEVEPVALSAVTSPVIRKSPKVNRLADDLNGQFKSEQLDNVLEIQKRIDEADLERLWQATVEKNPVIRFSLEKLATPADLQSKQSSKFLSKTLSLLISGASMGSTMLPGGGAYRNMGSMAVGNALQNMVSGKTQLAPGSLSPTEQIQMAGLIDELKLKLIHNYQDYKITLQALGQSHETTLKNNNLYSKALNTHNDLAVMASGAAYYQALLNETTLKQKAKLYRMTLERLAGTEAVSQLELSAVIPEHSTASNTKELIGPESPVEINEELIGPELPPARAAVQASRVTGNQKTKAKTTSKSPANALEIPQALEISPNLRAESMAPLPQLQVMSNNASSTRSAEKKSINTNKLPSPISDRILERKENRY